MSGSELTVLLGILSLPFSLPLPYLCSFSLKINKLKKIKSFKKEKGNGSELNAEWGADCF